MTLSFLNIVSLAWYLLGIIETMRTSDCSDKAPETYKLALALVIIFLAFLAFSCICRLVYIILLCFNHALLPNSQQGFLPDAGATEETILAIPTFIYSKDTDQIRPGEDNTCAI